MNRYCLAVFLGLGPLFAPHLLAGAASVREAGDSLRFANGQLVLVFDRQAGVWTGLETPQGVVCLRRAPTAPSLNVDVDGKPVFADQGMRLRGRNVVQLPAATRLELTMGQGDWSVVARYTLWDSGTLQRQATFAYSGPRPAGDHEVRNARFVLPDVNLPGADAFWFATAEYPPRDHPFRHTDAGRRFGFPFSESTFHGFLARASQAKLNLVSAYYTEDERARLVVQEGTGNATVVHTHLLAETLRPGLRFEVGSQLLRVVPGTRRDALEALQGFYDLPGLRTKIGMPTDTGRNIFYSAHPGGTIDSSFRDAGGFANFTKLLPSIRELGVNTLWLMPFWYGPVYAPYDYYRLDPKRCGTPAELKALTDKAHGLGMRVLGDLIPHGPREEAGTKPSFAEQHGDLVCRDKDGKMVQWWGCHYCDYANPGWQDYMAKHAAYWVRECGLDGYRVDVAAGGAPNWRPYGDNRPSFSGLHGGLALLRQARAACLKENPKTLFLAESTGPTMYSAVEHGYHWAFSALLEDHVLKDAPGDFVQAMSGYLENQTYAFPADAFPIRFLTNHDKLRARYCYGPNLHRALLALCAFMKGAPLLYHEEEIGNEDFIAKLYRIRQVYDELSIGKISYRSIPVEPRHVFCIEREYEGKRSVVLINFSNQTSEVKLSLPKTDLKNPGIYEAVTGQRIDYAQTLTQALDPYAYAVLVIRERDELPTPEPGDAKNRPATETTGTGVTFRKEGDLLHIAAPAYSAIIDGSRGGLLREIRGADGEILVRGMELLEGRRKLFVGCDPLDVAKTHADVSLPTGGTSTGSGEMVYPVVVTGELKDRDGVPRLQYRLAYAPRMDRLACRVAITPLTQLPPTKSDLLLRLRFSPVSHWFADTVEGRLVGRALRRHPADQEFFGRYWHGSGAAFHDASLHPTRGGLGVFDEKRDTAVEITAPQEADGSVPLRLVEDKRPDSPSVLGGPAGVAAEIQLLSSARKTVWEKGVERATDMELRFRQGGADLAGTGGAASTFGGGWSTYGPQYSIAANGLRATVVRSHGGELIGVTDASGKGLRISDARFYTDQGLFGEWHDPRGNARKMNATNVYDPEPDTQLLRLPDRPDALRFHSFFRHPHAHGRSLLNPRIEYEIAYTPPDRTGVGLRVECRARPHLVKLDTAGFLAYKLSLKGCDQWRVGDGEWQSLPEQSARIWESKEVGHLPKALTLRDSKTGDWTEFSDFDAAQGQVQNVFLHAGQGQIHLFVAFYDAEPTDIRPVWRHAAFTIKAGGEQ